MAVRGADFAGSWYPDRKADVLKTIKKFEKEAKGPKVLTGDLVGGIVPHAGWYFSGKLACNVVKVLSEHSKADTLLVFGSHMGPGHVPKIMSSGAWWTPLGDVPIDEEVVQAITGRFDFNEESSVHYDPDNTLELQMPFIRHYFPDVKVVTIGAPPTDDSLRMGEELVSISKDLGRKVAVLGSTDMTHYGPNYGMMPEGVGKKAVKWVKEVNDKRVIDLMVKLEPTMVIEEAIENHNACCMGAAGTALHVGRLLGATKGEVLDYYTSYDIDPNTSFVGYLGMVF